MYFTWRAIGNSFFLLAVNFLKSFKINYINMRRNFEVKLQELLIVVHVLLRT